MRKLELEKAVIRRRLEVQLELSEQRQKLEREKMQMELEFEKELLTKAIADEEIHCQQQLAMRNELQNKLRALRVQREKSENISTIWGPEKSSENKVASRVEKESSARHPEDYRGAYHKHSTPKKAEKPTEFDEIRQNRELRVVDDESSSQSEAEESSESREPKGPTKAQLSARQFLAKKATSVHWTPRRLANVYFEF